MPVSQEALEEVRELSGVITVGDDYLPADVRAECKRIIHEVHEVKPEDASDTYLFLKAHYGVNLSSSQTDD